MTYEVINAEFAQGDLVEGRVLVLTLKNVQTGIMEDFPLFYSDKNLNKDLRSKGLTFFNKIDEFELLSLYATATIEGTIVSKKKGDKYLPDESMLGMTYRLADGSTKQITNEDVAAGKELTVHTDGLRIDYDKPFVMIFDRKFIRETRLAYADAIKETVKQ